MRSLWTVPALVFLLGLSLSFDVYMFSTIIIVTPVTNNGEGVDSEGNPIGVFVYDPGEAGITVSWGDPPWEVDTPADASEPPGWFEWVGWDPCKEALP